MVGVGYGMLVRQFRDVGPVLSGCYELFTRCYTKGLLSCLLG